jgi:CRP/FNR family transcriptional regulator, cyclic AMP receptor protein
MAEPEHIAFDAPAFLAEAGLGRKIIQLKPKQAFFSQGGRADSIFYLQSGRAKLTVFSEKGNGAIVTCSFSQRRRSQAVVKRSNSKSTIEFP